MKQVRPEMVTSFMPLRGNRAKEYEEIRDVVRDKRTLYNPSKKKALKKRIEGLA